MVDSGPQYADVILVVPAGDYYSYRIPESLKGKITPGLRVIVPFGKKYHTALVCAVHSVSKGDFRYREIVARVDEHPLVVEQQLSFWRWISGYYICALGDVYKAAVPSVLRPEGDTPGQILKALRPREITYVKLANAWMRSGRKDIYALLKRAPGQREILSCFFRFLDQSRQDIRGIRQSELLSSAGASRQALKALIDKGILESFTETGPAPGPETDNTPVTPPGILSDDQQEAFSRIRECFSEKPAVLLHGVAASGKTEIYIQLIREQLQKGNRVLYLLPEIALTAQIVERLKRVFGEQVAVFHSKYTEQQRAAVYRELLKPGSRYRVVIGARSAVFLPVLRVGLIIVDEEHDGSFKQSEPSPRYHARDAAMVLAEITGAKVLLGSATPALETYFNARNRKYGLVELRVRYGGYVAPEIRLVDLKEMYRKRKMRSHFSPLLLEKMEHYLYRGRQVILFQNRRGYAPFLQCESCGHIPVCRFCDVTLTYHHKKARLECHYCGFSRALTEKCPVCQSSRMMPRGFGTEKIEDELKHLFPDSKVVRMDMDTTGTRRKYEKIIRDFEEEKVQILVGTQIITKGLDFGSVGLVGILNADNMLFFPDFRAFERSYQLLMQVAGRAGRRQEPGEVVIQTSDPGHTVIRELLDGSYRDFYMGQMQERRDFGYPPYCRLIKLTMKHRDEAVLKDSAGRIAGDIKKMRDVQVLGPQPPLVPRVRNLYLMNILIKFKKPDPVPESRSNLKEILSRKEYAHLRIIADVDPL